MVYIEKLSVIKKMKYKLKHIHRLMKVYEYLS